MKKIFPFTCLLILLATSGCIVAEGRRHRHSEAVIVGPPVVVVRPPVIIVH